MHEIVFFAISWRPKKRGRQKYFTSHRDSVKVSVWDRCVFTFSTLGIDKQYLLYSSAIQETRHIRSLVRILNTRTKSAGTHYPAARIF
jgi:hypothetical protein